MIFNDAIRLLHMKQAAERSQQRQRMKSRREWETLQHKLAALLFKDAPQGLKQYQDRLRGIERRYAIVMARRSGLPSPSWSYSNQLTNCQFDYNGQEGKIVLHNSTKEQQ